MTSITWAGPRCVQQLGAFLGPENRTQRRSAYILWLIKNWSILRIHLSQTDTDLPDPHISRAQPTHHRLSHDCSHGDIRDKGLGFILLRHYRKVSSQPSYGEVLCWECAEWGCSNQAAVKMAVKTMLAADKIRRLQGTVASTDRECPHFSSQHCRYVHWPPIGQNTAGTLASYWSEYCKHWPPIGQNTADTGLLLVRILCPHSRYIVII